MTRTIKKVLFVSSYDLNRNTSSNIRTIALMQGLQKMNVEVHCLYLLSNKEKDPAIADALQRCCKKIFSYPSAVKTASVSSAAAKKETKVHSVVSELRQWCIQQYTNHAVYDVFQVQFLRLPSRFYLDVDTDYDAVISSSEPKSSHKLARLLLKKKKLNCPWVQYWGDPMTNDVATAGRRTIRAQKTEFQLLSECDSAIYTNPMAMEYMQQAYPSLADKIHWVPTSDLAKDTHDGKIRHIRQVAYLGDYLSKYRDILPLYTACNRLGIKTKIAGNGDVVLKETPNVTIMPRVSKQQADDIEEASTILIVLENKAIGNVEKCIQVPGKLYHYALTDKTVLVITESDSLQKHYEKYNRFVFVNNDSREIQNALENIIRNSDAGATRDQSLEAFSQVRVAREFLRNIGAV